MKQGILLLFFILILSFEALPQSKIIGEQEFLFTSGEWYKKDRSGKSYKIDKEVITIKFRTSDVENFIGNHGLSIVRKSATGYYDIQIPSNLSILEVVEQIQKESSMIESIDVNTYGEYSFSPNDPQFSNQWYLNRIGMISGWDKAKGNNCIQIAIIDSGLDIAHEDIGRGTDTYDNLWRNLGEDAWSDPNNPATGNGVDNDGNGLIDDWRGWDFVDSNNDVRSPGNFHGTHVGGIVSAKLNNNRGVSGIGGGSSNSGLQLMILGAGENSPSSAALDDAILYAVQNGADVIQMSLGVAQTAAIDNAIQTAINNGIPVVCSSGNQNTGVSYPANNANVIAVGSTNQNDQRSSFSNFGPELFIAAPGEQIRSTQLNNTYGNSDGTSFAAPQISAVIGLIRSINPNLTVQQIRGILSGTADKVGGVDYNWDPNMPGHSRELGFGRLNANAALNSIFPSISGPGLICSNGSFILNNQPPGSTITWTTNNPTGLSINLNTGVATRQNNYDGPVIVHAWINGFCGTYSVSRFVWVGRPTSSISGPQLVYPGQLYTYNTIDPNQNGAGYYLWSVEGGLIYGGGGVSSTSITIFWNESGFIELISDNVCGTSVGHLDVTVDIGGGCNPCQIMQTYPNPSSEELKITLNEEVVTDKKTNKILPTKISLVDNMQIVVYSITTNNLEINIPTGSLPQGLYVLRLSNNSGTETRQILVKR